MTLFRIKNEKKLNFKVNILVNMLFILSIVMMPYTICKAASATITLSTDKTSVTTGDEITVSIQLSSEVLIGDFEAYLTYNDDILEFKNASSRIAGGDGLIKISDMNVVEEEYTRKYAITFQALKVGNSEISIKENPHIYEYDSGIDMSVSVNQITIQVAAAKTASSNTKLKSLKINPGVLSPEFQTDITEYTTQVDAATEKIIVSAIPEDNSSTVELKGNDKLAEGNNEIIITVKAESGHKKKYTIQAVREKNEPEETGDETMDDSLEETLEEDSLSSNITEINSISAISEEGSIYLKNGFLYQIIPVSDETIIPEGYVRTTAVIDETVIDAYALQNNTDSDFLLLYAKNTEGKPGFYQYDRVENTMQRFDYKKTGTGKKQVLTNEILHSEDYKSRITTMGIVIAILGAIVISMSLAILRMYIKSKEPKE